MLKFAGAPYKVPDHVYVHGFIGVSGEKMSKSRGTGIDPLRYLELGMNPEWLRYYIAAKLNANVEDLDFNPDDFLARVNSDLVGKYVNIASRAAGFFRSSSTAVVNSNTAIRIGFLQQVFDGDSCRISDQFADALRFTGIRQGNSRGHAICRSCESVYDPAKPWDLAKEHSKRARTSPRLLAMRSIALSCADDLLAPILPATGQRAPENFSGWIRRIAFEDAGC